MIEPAFGVEPNRHRGVTHAVCDFSSQIGITRRRIFKEFARVSKSWVLVSFYHSNCLKRFKKLLRGKSVSGEYVSFSALRAEAAEAGLRVVRTSAVARYVLPQWFVLFAVR